MFAQSDTAETHASRLGNALEVACPGPPRPDIGIAVTRFPATEPVKAHPELAQEYVPTANAIPFTFKVKVPEDAFP